MLSAVLLVATHFDTFYERLPNYYEFFRWNTLLYTWLALGVVKVIHEFGHGLSCKAFGGECHEMGALFLCLSPCLYCNVSDSWTLPNKWRRIIISFAGIYVELVIAALATWVWWYTPGRPVINNVALCVMVLCSVSTVVFNANPLMRFDGYYILADWLEIPNLRDRSNRMLKNLTCEHALGMEVQPEPYMETWRKVLFVTYAITSYIYRWVLTFSILYFLSNWLKPYKLGALSALLAIAALGSMVGWPIYRLLKGLHKRGRFPDMKRSRVTVSSAILIAVLLAFFLVPLPISRVRQTGLVQIEPTLVQKVTVPSDGRLMVLHVHNGQRVTKGQMLAEFRSSKLEAEYKSALGDRDKASAQVEAVKTRQKKATESEELKQLHDEFANATSLLREANSKVDLARSEMDDLRRLDAPCDGIVLGGPQPDDIGKLWEKAAPTPFCQIGDPKELRVLVPVPPSDYRVLQQDMSKVDRLAVSIHFPGRGSDIVLGQVTRLPESDAKEVPLQLTQRGGGPLAAKPNAPTADPNIQSPQSQQYLVAVEIINPDPAICPGTLAKVKIHCNWRSTAWWAWHKISSAFDLTLI
jgi:putative peptide zinc metalloprotease protein